MISKINSTIGFQARLHLEGPGYEDMTDNEKAELKSIARKINNKKVQDIFIIAGEKNHVDETDVIATFISNKNLYGVRNETVRNYIIDGIFEYSKNYLNEILKMTTKNKE